jgi:Lrp/AsnC family transcriptional regulator, leucine-responsive regulatory protein
MKLDALDKKILELLQGNGRMPNARLAAQCGISPPATLERVKRLESAGVIEGYAAVVNARNIGLGLTAMVSLSLAVHGVSALSAVKSRIEAIPEVLECHHISGDVDFLLKVVVRDMDAYTDFVVNKLSNIEGIQKINSAFVLATVKDSRRLPIDAIDGG